MNCPHCENEVLCHCRNCDKVNLGKVREIYRSEKLYDLSGNPLLGVFDEHLIAEYQRCGYCGFEMSMDEWFSYEANRYVYNENCVCGHTKHGHDKKHGQVKCDRCDCQKYQIKESTALMLRRLCNTETNSLKT